jgi:hypothetical protein
MLLYATPPPASGFVCAPPWVIAIVAAVVPGLSSCLILGTAGLRKMLLLWLVLIAAFLLFGPLWGEVLFRRTPLQEMGLYPFMAIYAAVDVASVILALRDRRRVSEG